MHTVVIPRVMQILHLARHARHFYSPYRRDSHENSANPWPNAIIRLHLEPTGLHRSRLTTHDLTSRQLIGVSMYIKWLPCCCSVGSATTVSVDRCKHHWCSFLHGLIPAVRPLVRVAGLLSRNSKCVTHAARDAIGKNNKYLYKSTLHRFSYK